MSASPVPVESPDAVEELCSEARILANRIDVLLSLTAAQAQGDRAPIRIARGLVGTLIDQLDVVARRR